MEPVTTVEELPTVYDDSEVESVAVSRALGSVDAAEPAVKDIVFTRLPAAEPMGRSTPRSSDFIAPFAACAQERSLLERSRTWRIYEYAP